MILSKQTPTSLKEIIEHVLIYFKESFFIYTLTQYCTFANVKNL